MLKRLRKGMNVVLSIAKYNDLQEKDIIEAYREVEVAKKL